MLSTQTVVYTDRFGDRLVIEARDHSEYGNPVPDPILFVESPSRKEMASIIFTEHEFRGILKTMAREILGEEWDAV